MVKEAKADELLQYLKELEEKHKILKEMAAARQTKGPRATATLTTYGFDSYHIYMNENGWDFFRNHARTDL